MSNGKIILVLGVIFLLISIAVNYEKLYTKEYSIKDVEIQSSKDNRTNEIFVLVNLPDKTEIKTNTKTGESIILQPEGLTIELFSGRGVGIRLRDGTIYGDKNWIPSLLKKEDKSIQELYLINKKKIIENGRTLDLPDKTRIYLEEKNKIIIRLKSRISIVKDDDGSIAVKFSDGLLVKMKGRDWETYPIIEGQVYRSTGIKWE